MAAPRRKPASSKTARKSIAADAVVDRALTMAHDVGWDNLSLRELAGDLGLTPAELAALFKDKDAIADAWFTHARDAMLAAREDGKGGSDEG